jgi:FkbM family methyltransferase
MTRKTPLNQFLRSAKNTLYPNRIWKRNRSGSQFGQDLFVIEHLQKSHGFFVEIGVGDGKRLSNTYLLEKKYEWNGILCEPNAVFHKAIARFRSASLDRRAAFSESGKRVSFLCCPVGELSTFSEYKNGDQHTRIGKEIEVETVSLMDLLTQHNAPDVIDYLSVDTEGSELDILKTFDFSRFNVLVLTVEHNFNKERIAALDGLLTPLGYERVHADKSHIDAWYIKTQLA